MIYFLYGDDDFQIDRRMNELRRQFIKQNSADGVVNVDVNDVAAADAMRQLTAVSLFMANQLVLVKGITASTECWAMLESNVDYIPDTTTVVLTDVKTLSKVNNVAITKTFKKLKSSGATIEKFTKPKAWEVEPWLTGEIKRRKLQASNTVIKKLIQLTAGEDNQRARLSSELDKLALLNQPLTIRLVSDYVEPSLDTNAFAVFDAAVTGQADRAVRMLCQLRDSGEDYNRFLGLLASQELALAAAITGAKNKISPYQLKQAQATARQLGNLAQQRAKLSRIATKLADLDAAVKIAKPEEAWLRIEVALNQP